MKILLYTPTVGRGGVHRVVETLFPALVHHNPDVCFEVFGQEFDEIGREVHYPVPLRSMTPHRPFPAHPDQFPYLMANSGRFYSHLQRFSAGFDLIYCPSPWWTMGFSRWTLSVPFVTTISDFAFDVIDMGDLAPYFRSVVKKMRPHVSAFVVHSQYWKNHAETVYNLSNVSVIEHSRDFINTNFTPTPEEGQRVREKYQLPERYVLAFHCYGHKDPLTIIRGHAWARRNNGQVPPLVIAGLETGAYQPCAPIVGGAEAHVREVRSALYDARSSENIIVLGEIPDADVAGLYKNATCAISATRSEGDLPGTAFEAISARIPFVCSDFPIFLEKLGHECAWIFECGNHDMLGMRLIQVCTEETASKVEKAATRLTGRTAKDVAEAYMDVFRSVLRA